MEKILKKNLRNYQSFEVVNNGQNCRKMKIFIKKRKDYIFGQNEVWNHLRIVAKKSLSYGEDGIWIGYKGADFELQRNKNSK